MTWRHCSWHPLETLGHTCCRCPCCRWVVPGGLAGGGWAAGGAGAAAGAGCLAAAGCCCRCCTCCRVRDRLCGRGWAAGEMDAAASVGRLAAAGCSCRCCRRRAVPAAAGVGHSTAESCCRADAGAGAADRSSWCWPPGGVRRNHSKWFLPLCTMCTSAAASAGPPCAGPAKDRIQNRQTRHVREHGKFRSTGSQ
jgi:hypothetical protein